MKTGSQPLVLLLVGLPGAGKTTLARRLAPAIDAVTLSRDDIRDAIFPEALLDYSSEQNQVGTDALLGVLGYLLAKPKPAFIIVDGKPFSRKAEIATVKQLVEASGARLLILHCIAPQAVIEGRLQRGLSDARNVRAQRDPEKAARIRAEFEAIDLPHVVVDTSRDQQDVLALCLAAIESATAPALGQSPAS